MSYWKSTLTYLQYLNAAGNFSRAAVKATLKPKYQPLDLFHFRMAEYSPRGTPLRKQTVSNLGIPGVDAVSTALNRKPAA